MIILLGSLVLYLLFKLQDRKPNHSIIKERFREELDELSRKQPRKEPTPHQSLGPSIVPTIKAVAHDDALALRKELEAARQQAKLAEAERDQAKAEAEALRAKAKHSNQYTETEDLKQAWQLLVNSHDSLFITGKAGTGKTTLLKRFIKESGQKNLVVTAYMGIAALNVGGQTIHSLFKFPFDVLEEKNIPKDDSQKELYKKLEVLIIDEISMVRVDMLEAIDLSLQWHRDSKAPFGGVRMLLFGDPFQLPPIAKKGAVTNCLASRYGGKFFFHAKSFGRLNPRCLELKTIFRQANDERLISILNNIRSNQVTEDDMHLLNTRHDPLAEPDPNDDKTTICAYKKEVARINTGCLERLDSPEKTYKAQIVDWNTKAGKNNENWTDPPAATDLKLKVGAKIMMLKNDPDGRWVNGTLGIVSKLSDKDIHVKIDGIAHQIGRVTWENTEAFYDRKKNEITKRVTGSFSQFPVALAWSFTIHKSQGQTLKRVRIDLGIGAFEVGQVYTALSRCTSMDGLFLNRKINKSDIIFAAEVEKFTREWLKN